MIETRHFQIVTVCWRNPQAYIGVSQSKKESLKGARAIVKDIADMDTGNRKSRLVPYEHVL